MDAKGYWRQGAWSAAATWVAGMLKLPVPPPASSSGKEKADYSLWEEVALSVTDGRVVWGHENGHAWAQVEGISFACSPISVSSRVMFYYRLEAARAFAGRRSPAEAIFFEGLMVDGENVALGFDAR